MLEKLKNFFVNASVGFWISIGCLVVTLFLLISYPANFNASIVYYEPKTVLILGLTLGIAVGLFVGGFFYDYLLEFIPAILAMGLFTAFLFFVKGTWMMIQDAIGGYEFFGMSASFWMFAIPALVAIVASVVSIFAFPQRKRA